MSDQMYESYEEMKGFVGLDDTSIARLKALAPLFEEHGGGITDRFYDNLGRNANTAAFIEGRVDALKATHRAWMSQLFSGDYGREYFDGRIGEAHVRIGLPPQFVEGVMSAIRSEGTAIIYQNCSAEEAPGYVKSLINILDLDLIINLAYAGERLDMVSSVTGMRRALIENLIRQGVRRKQKAALKRD